MKRLLAMAAILLIGSLAQAVPVDAQGPDLTVLSPKEGDTIQGTDVTVSY